MENFDHQEEVNMNFSPVSTKTREVKKKKKRKSGDEEEPHASKKLKKKEDSPDYSGIDLLFKIDTAPATNIDIESIPSYKRTIKEVLNDENKELKKKKEDECQRVRPTSSCFNCESTEHGIRDCPKPRNMDRINRAKKARGQKQERYHVDTEQRFAHIKPGQISDKLREALNLRPGEIPFFFYRMREIGYPPGWMEEAKVAHSGLRLINDDGTAALNPTEEGDPMNLPVKYDISKIIDFPGFNTDPGPNFFDDYKFHNVRPMCKSQSKENFIKGLGDSVAKGYKRKKLKFANNQNCGVDESSVGVFDMEIEDPEAADNQNVVFTRPMPPPDSLKTSKNLTPPQPPPDRPESPTLSDLEAQHKKLLEELEVSVTSAANVTKDDDSLLNDVLELEGMAHSLDDKSKVSTNSRTSVTAAIPIPKKADNIKDTYIGTPILKFSPFEKLPDGEKFKVGVVGDVINFENLPDSTGKYEQMKVVIKRVRNAITLMHDDDE